MQQKQIDELMAVIRTVEDLSGARLCLHEASSKLTRYIPDVPIFHRNAVCRFIKKQFPGNERDCIMFDRIAVKHQLKQCGRVFFKRCPFGVTELVIPLLRENDLLGIVFLGPFSCPEKLFDADSLIGRSHRNSSDKVVSGEKIRVLDAGSCREIYNLGLMLKAYFSRWMENIVFDAVTPETRREQIMKFFDRNFANTLQINDLARFLFLSKSRTGQLLKQYFDCGFSELLLRRRLEHACGMLERSEHTVKLIAGNCGYSNLEYFYRIFRRTYGMTPMAYRDSHTH